MIIFAYLIGVLWEMDFNTWNNNSKIVFHISIKMICWVFDSDNANVNISIWILMINDTTQIMIGIFSAISYLMSCLNFSTSYF